MILRKTEQSLSLFLFFPPVQDDTASQTLCNGGKGHVFDAEPHAPFPLHLIADGNDTGVVERPLLVQGGPLPCIRGLPAPLMRIYFAAEPVFQIGKPLDGLAIFHQDKLPRLPVSSRRGLGSRQDNLPQLRFRSPSLITADGPPLLDRVIKVHFTPPSYALWSRRCSSYGGCGLPPGGIRLLSIRRKCADSIRAFRKYAVYLGPVCQSNKPLFPR